MAWKVFITNNAEKQFSRLPRDRQAQVLKARKQLEQDPFSGDVAKLYGHENFWRLRVGSYRIIFKVLYENRAVFVYEIARRTSSTY